MGKKEEIVQKSKQLLVKYGYNRVSMNEIASHCGFTKKTLYSYFDSKDALVASIIEK